MRKDNIEHIIEYAVYHDNLDKKISLPGIKNGFPVKSFFSKKKLWWYEESGNTCKKYRQAPVEKSWIPTHKQNS